MVGSSGVEAAAGRATAVGAGGADRPAVMARALRRPNTNASVVPQSGVACDS
jgi:hypothetical protein